MGEEWDARGAGSARVCLNDRRPVAGETLDQIRGRHSTGTRLKPPGDGIQPPLTVPVRQHVVKRRDEVGAGELIRGEPDAEAELADALGVVVLIPEERQDEHRFAEEEALRRRIVSPVGDDGVDPRQNRRLRQERFAVHIVRQS